MRESSSATGKTLFRSARIALARLAAIFLTLTTIVSFADTTWAQTSATTEPEIRVLFAHAPETPTISCSGACSIIPYGGNLNGRLMLKFDAVKVSWEKGVFKLGETAYKCNALDIVPEKGQTLSLDKKTFAGSFRLTSNENKLVTINIVPIETYLLGVLPHEMPSSWPAEALKAQAVAARTYALYSRQERTKELWDVTSTVDDQVYGGGKAPASIVKAVTATRGQVLLHQKKKLFPTFFHSTCGGSTVIPSLALDRSGFDFIGSQPCTYCQNSPHFRWRKWMSTADIIAKLKTQDITAKAPLKAISLQPGGKEGGLLAVVEWEGGRAELPVAEFRRALGRMEIKSGRFTCVAMNGGFFFYGSGLGHGAGMCQYGAAGLAREGKTYKEILQYYYQETTLTTRYK